MRKILILGLALMLTTGAGMIVFAQEDSNGVLDLGVDLAFYQSNQNVSLRLDSEPFGIPTTVKIEPKVQTNSVVLDRISLGLKYPEPFGLDNVYITGIAPLKFYEKFDENNDKFIATRFDPVEIGVGYYNKVHEKFKGRIEFFAEDFLSEDRVYRVDFSLEYIF